MGNSKKFVGFPIALTMWKSVILNKAILHNFIYKYIKQTNFHIAKAMGNSKNFNPADRHDLSPALSFKRSSLELKEVQS